MKMEKGVNIYQFPHFFKVYMPLSSSQRMKLPPGFGQKISEGPIPRKLFLTNRRGKRFSVGLGSRGNDLFFEGDGWVQLVRDNSLVENHILVFFFDGIDTFDFKIFELNGCEKIDEDGEKGGAEVAAIIAVEEINEAEETNGKDEDAEEGVKEEEEKLVETNREKRKAKDRKKIDIYGADIFRSGAYIQPVNPYFVTRVRRGRKDMVYIPADVVKDLKYELGDTINVRDPRGRTYTLKLKVWKDRRWYKDGWKRLCESNLVREGDRIICELIEIDDQQCVEMQIINIISN